MRSPRKAPGSQVVPVLSTTLLYGWRRKGRLRGWGLRGRTIGKGHYRFRAAPGITKVSSGDMIQVALSGRGRETLSGYARVIMDERRGFFDVMVMRFSSSELVSRHADFELCVRRAVRDCGSGDVSPAIASPARRR